MTFKTQSGSETSHHKLNLIQKPKAIDYVRVVSSGASKATLGIYLLDGNILTLCVNHGEVRPTEFSSELKVKGKPESLLVLMVYKRRQ